MRSVVGESDIVFDLLLYFHIAFTTATPNKEIDRKGEC